MKTASLFFAAIIFLSAQEALPQSLKQNPISHTKKERAKKQYKKVEKHSTSEPKSCPTSLWFRNLFHQNMNAFLSHAPEPLRTKLSDPRTYQTALMFIIKKSVHYGCLYWGGYTPGDMQEFWDLYKTSELISSSGL